VAEPGVKEKRFKCINSTGGNRESDSCLVARRKTLHLGQCLRQTELIPHKDASQ
jgi:hypothetical protein